MPMFDTANVDSIGVVAIGKSLSVATLLAAYRSGVFPMYSTDSPVVWWCPDPRAIIPLDGLHVSRRLARTIRSGKFTVTFDRDFRGTIRGCAENRPEEEVWLHPEMIEAYSHLFDLGFAHSVEVWQGDQLAGGIYGVALGGLFAAESMFTRVTDASKVALAALVERLNERNFAMLDVQIINPHTERMGAIEIPRDQFLRRLREAIRLDRTFPGADSESHRSEQSAQ